MHGEFTQHLRAAFDSGGKQIPQWLLNCQLSAREQIELAGMSGQLAFTLNGFNASQERADEPFEVFIVGEGKHGKSTLINALMGCSVAPTDRLPKTWCFNRYVATPSPDENVRLFVQGSLDTYPHLHKTLGPKLGETRGLSEYRISRHAAEQVVQEEEAKWAQGQSRAYVSPIMEMEWQVTAEKALLPGLRLVDTQGIGQIHSDYAHRHYLKWQYERADAVLWLLAQDKIGATATDKEINDARRYAKPIILVLNKWDEIKGDPGRQLSKAHEIYGDRVNAIVPFSALEAFLAVEPKGYEYQKGDYKRLDKHQGKTWSDLRAASGLDHLVEVFQQMVWSKASLVRNAQLYSATRRKQAEYRSVMTRRIQEIDHNIIQYRNMLDAIHRADADNRRRVPGGFATVLQQSLSAIEASSSQIVWGNKHLAHSLLQLDVISTAILQAQRNLAQQCTYRFAEVVSEGQNARRYRNSESASDGSVALVEQMLSMSDPNVTVMPIETNWQVEIPSSLWDDLSRGFRWIIGHFSEDARKGLETEDQEIRARIKTLCSEQLKSHIENAIRSFDTPISNVNSRLKGDLNRHIDRLGGIHYLEAAKPKIQHVLTKVAVPCIFIAMPTTLMRRLNWPCIGSSEVTRKK